MAFDLAVVGTFLGGAATGLLTRFLGITQRMQSFERRLDTQAELIANLTSENSALRQKVGEQDAVIRRQAHRIGALTRANRELSELARKNEADLRQKHADNEALASDLNSLRLEIWGGNTRPSGLPEELYGSQRPQDVRLPRPPKLPKL